MHSSHLGLVTRLTLKSLEYFESFLIEHGSNSLIEKDNLSSVRKAVLKLNLQIRDFLREPLLMILKRISPLMVEFGQVKDMTSLGL